MKIDFSKVIFSDEYKTLMDGDWDRDWVCWNFFHKPKLNNHQSFDKNQYITGTMCPLQEQAWEKSGSLKRYFPHDLQHANLMHYIFDLAGRKDPNFREEIYPTSDLTIPLWIFQVQLDPSKVQLRTWLFFPNISTRLM